MLLYGIVFHVTCNGDKMSAGSYVVVAIGSALMTTWVSQALQTCPNQWLKDYPYHSLFSPFLALAGTSILFDNKRFTSINVLKVVETD